VVAHPNKDFIKEQETLVNVRNLNTNTRLLNTIIKLCSKWCKQ